MRGHGYKHRRGTYFRGRSKGGRYYTRQGCLMPILTILVITVIIMLYML